MNKRKNGDLQGTNELARWERGNLAKASNRILAHAFENGSEEKCALYQGCMALGDFSRSFSQRLDRLRRTDLTDCQSKVRCEND